MEGRNENSPPARPRRAPHEEALFDAVLRPHRSLSPAGFGILMAALAVGLAGLGFVFFAIGAWPVLGFCGLEFGLLYLAFRINYRDGRACEHLRLGAAMLEVRRLDGRGRLRGTWQFQPNWLRVTMDDPPEHGSQLALSSHGRELIIGSFLTPEERLDLAHALRRALEAWRTAPQPGPGAQ